MSTPDQTLNSGADLARIALRQAKEAARARGNAPKKKIKRTSFRHARGDGRDPVALLGVVKQLVVDRGWEGGADVRRRDRDAHRGVLLGRLGHLAPTCRPADRRRGE
ncbi:hypothetical protein ACIOJ9_29405 [Streptomyces sp. NPDC088175]|uniref:hypothetical protein n=1 Tax=unclassified Streptomyces TaxID=2593676 RepID=UPI00381989C2